MDANRNRMILSFLVGCVAGMLLLLFVSWAVGPASAQTRVNIPFPAETRVPIYVPKYTLREDSWPVSLVFAPFVVGMAIIATIADQKLGGDTVIGKNSKNLRKTAAVMLLDGVIGAKKFRDKRVERRAMLQKRKAGSKCVPVGNWVGAPCN